MKTSKPLSWISITLCSLVFIGLTVRAATLNIANSKLQKIKTRLDTAHQQLTADVAETRRLSTKLTADTELNDQKLYRVARACDLASTVDEFPVREGPFIATGHQRRPGGMDVNYFAPKGNHFMVVTLKFENIELKGPGIDIHTREQFAKYKFPIPANSVGQMRFRLENKESSCLGLITIVDESNKPIATKEIELEHRKVEANLYSSSGGKSVFIPGQLDCSFVRSHDYNTESFRFSLIDKMIRRLNVSYVIWSPDADIFVHPKEIGGGLGRYISTKNPFETYFHPANEQGRFIYKDTAPYPVSRNISLEDAE